MRAPALSSILAFRIFSYYYPVNIFIFSITKRTLSAWEGSYRSNVRIELKGSSEGKEKTPQGYVIGDI